MIYRFLSRIKRQVALFLLFVFSSQLLLPLKAHALTSGPSQPEMESFEPVGTTDMVNPFTGDFTYNIPLMDIDGYPINIAYHSGVTMDQEASWVGLGWNINPGNITRTVRGLPDDFNGEVVEKSVYMNDEVKKRFGTGVGMELAGFLGIGSDYGLSISNYNGVSSSYGMHIDAKIPLGPITPGVGLGTTVTTDEGVEIDPSASFSYKSTSSLTSNLNGSFSKSYNSRQGLMSTGFGVNVMINRYRKSENPGERSVALTGINISGSAVPTSRTNMVPVITNSSQMISLYTQFKTGGEVMTWYPHFQGSFGIDHLHFDKNGDAKGYGYFNLQNGNNEDLMDFTRDRDGHFNKTQSYLPACNMTYDVLSVNGQGTGGSFRPFRNDVGTVYDAYRSTEGKSFAGTVELGYGNLLEGGWDQTGSYTESKSGPWSAYQKRFASKKSNSLFEPHYFKSGGELTQANEDYLELIDGMGPLNHDQLHEVLTKGNPQEKEENLQRPVRANLLYYFTAAEASNKWVAVDKYIEDYTHPNGEAGSPTPTPIPRVGDARKPYHVSEITQLQPNGTRYIYGLPAMNNTQIEYTTSCEGTGDPTTGMVDLDGLPPYTGAQSYVDGAHILQERMHIKSKTPAYAHTYLLTALLSSDYSDLTGDGISPDDLGNYTKFNYSRKNNNYIWRSPYPTHSAEFDDGVKSTCHDDKGSFVIGSKEIWMLHSIETRNYVAEFYVSPRTDGLGSDDYSAADLDGATPQGVMYKLDKIVLYNKSERQHINTDGTVSIITDAVPIKSVLFTYDYSLCKGIPNTSDPGSGKLTLKAIAIKYGNSDIGMLTPYRFKYSSNNPEYNFLKKDCWGSFKDHNLEFNLSNHEFPYVNQIKSNADSNASAWNLTQVQLPSGGSIQVDYEADDYSFVQDRHAMEMFPVAGVGATSDWASMQQVLYKDKNNPYCYIFFKRKKIGSDYDEEYEEDLLKSYLPSDSIVQFSFNVSIDGDNHTASCPNTPLTDQVKGYAKVDSIGISSNPDYGFIKLIKREDIDGVTLNPVTLSALNYARYYNNKALYPSEELMDPDAVAVIKKLIAGFAGYSDYFSSPFIRYLDKGKAKAFDATKSYIRLCSQFKKYGGSHRVKKIQFFDHWDDMSGGAAATYGTEYEYTVEDIDGVVRSSGVAAYEPLIGGDENPFKEPQKGAGLTVGEQRKFPVLQPIELLNEGPIGESLYPPAEVGYSRVTARSIHFNEGKSSQTLHVEDYYTARDFPIRVSYSELERLDNYEIKWYDVRPNTEEAYRVAQGYSVTFNDMHGKLHAIHDYVIKAGKPQDVSSQTYEYFKNADGSLCNKVPCITEGADMTESTYKVKQFTDHLVGIETDFTVDSREKSDKTTTVGFNFNLNTFTVAAGAILVPTGFPPQPKSVAHNFSSVVNTKIIQQYGILKSVTSVDRGGAKVIMTNLAFDAQSGTPVISTVNTEQDDQEFQIKYPAYWAFGQMGPAYQNILYDETLDNNASIVNDTLYFKAKYAERFNPGDELLLSINSSCMQGVNNVPQTYKVWVLNSNKSVTPESSYTSPHVVPEGNNCGCPADEGPDGALDFFLSIQCLKHHNKERFLYQEAMSITTPLNFFASFVNNDGSVHALVEPPPIPPDPPSAASILEKNTYGRDQICGIPGGAGGITGWKDHIHHFDKDLMSDISANAPAYLQSFMEFPNGKFPLEYFESYRPQGTNADFRSGGLATILDFNTATSDHDIDFRIPWIIPSGFGLSWGDYAVSDKLNLYLYGEDKPYDHLGLTNRGYSLQSYIRNEGTYNSQYHSLTDATHLYPYINQTKQVLEITISYERKSDLFYSTDGGTTKPLVGTYQDPTSPSGITNNLWSGTYTFRFPYDPTYALCSAVNLSDLNVATPTVCRVEHNPLYPSDPYIPLGASAVKVFEKGATPVDGTYTGSDVINTISGLQFYRTSTWYYTSSAKIVPRTTGVIDDADDIVTAIPLKRGGVTSGTGEGTDNKVLPKHDVIYSGNVEVIRSGNRNQLTETIQDALTLENVLTSGKINDHYISIINMAARIFTDAASTSETLADPDNDYFNPYVTGQKGNYRVSSELLRNAFRDYTVGSGNITPKNRGVMEADESIVPYWTNAGDSYPYSMTPDPHAITNGWFQKVNAAIYSPYGSDLEVIDDHNNRAANLFGYNSRLVTATLTNAHCNDAIFENFEDYPVSEDDYPIAPGILEFLQNKVRTFINSQSAPLVVPGGGHTGDRYLQSGDNISIPIPVLDASAIPPSNVLLPFFFRNGEKYVAGYWQKVPLNATIGTIGALRLNYAGGTITFHPKTPNIDGWVQYAAEFTVPDGAEHLDVTIAGGAGLDDIRLLPYASNMKCYVYNSTDHKLMAVLDENHMATFFDYSPEGKLVRLRKETEKGILTLKESRESLRNLIPPTGLHVADHVPDDGDGSSPPDPTE